MRGIKGTLAGAAVVAALLVMASLGVGSASAAVTKLCTVNPSPSPCPAADVYAANSKFTVTGEANISPLGGCAFTYKFETGNSAGSPLGGKITSFVFSHCSQSLTVTPLSLNWMFPISVTGTGPNGTAEMLTGAGGPPHIEITGGTLVGCVYSAPDIPQNITGGGTISVSGVTMTKIAGGSTCPTTISLATGAGATPAFYVTN
jgi:hypothetical protein